MLRCGARGGGGPTFARLQETDEGCAAVRAAEFLPPRETFFRSITRMTVGNRRGSTSGDTSVERGVRVSDTWGRHGKPLFRRGEGNLLFGFSMNEGGDLIRANC